LTGMDLVAEQFSIAEGNPLSLRQEAIRRSGHAIECRIYAEDPEASFLPDPGVVHRHRPPSGPGIRVDAGLDEGERVHLHYDPMIAKLIAWGRDRDEAIRRMRRALSEYEIAGLRTTIPFCLFVLDHPTFQRGEATTRFVEEHFSPELLGAQVDDETARLAAIASALHAESRSASPAPVSAVSVNGSGVSRAWLARRRY
ncbi:MAG TPA: biotin carboxylase, partial [Rhodothermales bacterium]